MLPATFFHRSRSQQKQVWGKILGASWLLKQTQKHGFWSYWDQKPSSTKKLESGKPLLPYGQGSLALNKFGGSRSKFCIPPDLFFINTTVVNSLLEQ